MNRIILDVETAGTFGKSLVYDLGFIVVDGNFTEIASCSWVIGDVYYGMPDKMNTAYYRDKLPQYDAEIAEGKREVKRLKDAYRIFNDICETYDVREVWAFNAKFDKDALNYTLKVCSKHFFDRFIPATVKIKCIMGAAMDTICKTQSYAMFAEKTEKNNVRVNAENVYRYISGDTEFVEEHTGLADSQIELEILKQCLKRRKKMDTDPKSITAFKSWQAIQKNWKSL